MKIELRDAILPSLELANPDHLYMVLKGVPGQFIVPQHTSNNSQTHHITNAFTRLPLRPTANVHKSVHKGALHVAMVKGITLSELDISLFDEEGNLLENEVKNLSDGLIDYMGAYLVNRTTVLQKQENMSRVELALEYDGTVAATTLTDAIFPRSAAEDVLSDGMTNQYVYFTDKEGLKFRLLLQTVTETAPGEYNITCWLPSDQVFAIEEGHDIIAISLTGPKVRSLDCKFLFAVTCADHEYQPQYRYMHQ